MEMSDNWDNYCYNTTFEPFKRLVDNARSGIWFISVATAGEAARVTLKRTDLP